MLQDFLVKECSEEKKYAITDNPAEMVVAEHGDITNLPKNVRGNLNELDTRFLIKSQLVKFYSHNMIEGFSEDGCICRFKFHDMICFSLQRKLES